MAAQHQPAMMAQQHHRAIAPPAGDTLRLALQGHGRGSGSLLIVGENEARRSLVESIGRAENCIRNAISRCVTNARTMQSELVNLESIRTSINQ